MDLNRIVIIGRLTRDAELKYLNGGTAIAEIGLAVNHRKRNDGSEEVSFFNAKAFGKLAENLKPYLLKGKQIAISGYLKQERWNGQDGTKHDRITITCDEIQLIGSKDANGQNGGYSQQNNGGYDYGYGN